LIVRSALEWRAHRSSDFAEQHASVLFDDGAMVGDPVAILDAYPQQEMNRLSFMRVRCATEEHLRRPVQIAGRTRLRDVIGDDAVAGEARSTRIAKVRRDPNRRPEVA
jgi:hypothetical protein